MLVLLFALLVCAAFLFPLHNVGLDDFFGVGLTPLSPPCLSATGTRGLVPVVCDDSYKRRICQPATGR